MLGKHIENWYTKVSHIINDNTNKIQEPITNNLALMPLVPKGSEEYVVRGDGPCLLRKTAAHMAGNEDEGLQLKRDLNTHFFK